MTFVQIIPVFFIELKQNRQSKNTEAGQAAHNLSSTEATP